MFYGFAVQSFAQVNTGKTPDPAANTIDLFLNHTVKKGETYYSLSREYKTTVKELQELNPDYPVLKTGAVIKVKRPVVVQSEPKPTIPQTSNEKSTPQANTTKPMGTPMPSATAKNNTQDSLKKIKESARVERTNLLLASDLDKAAVVVTVQTGETLYSISRKYGIAVERIKYLNDLDNDNLQIGQVLILPPEARKATTTHTNTTESNTTAVSPDALTSPASLAPVQKESEKIQLSPNNAIAPNPVVLSQKDSATKVASSSTVAQSQPQPPSVRSGEGNKRDAGGMPEQSAKKKLALKEYEKTVKVSVGLPGMDPERHWVLANNHKSGEVVALLNPDTKTLVWCVVMGSAKGKGDSEIVISEALSRKLNVDSKKPKLIFRYAAP